MENRNVSGEKSSGLSQTALIAILIGVFCFSGQYGDLPQFFSAVQIPEALIWEISGGIVMIISLFGLKKYYADDKITSES